MNFLRTLAEAIRKRSLGVELTSVEKAIYEQAYCDCLGKNNTDFNRDEEVYNYYCNLFEYNIRKSDMVPFRVFNTLLNSDGKSLSLVDFCKLLLIILILGVYKNIFMMKIFVVIL